LMLQQGWQADSTPNREPLPKLREAA